MFVLGFNVVSSIFGGSSVTVTWATLWLPSPHTFPVLSRAAGQHAEGRLTPTPELQPRRGLRTPQKRQGAREAWEWSMLALSTFWQI